MAACRALELDPAGIRLADLQAPAHRAALDRLTFVTATDGNHGRGVAWAARLLGCRCHVYLPAGSVEARAQAIRDAGAEEARILDVGYDDAVRYAARCAEERGWLLIQDTSWPGYTEVPTWIVQGYATMAREAAEHFCPWYSKAPRTSAVRTTSGSADGCASTKSLPPVSPTMRG